MPAPEKVGVAVSWGKLIGPIQGFNFFPFSQLDNSAKCIEYSKREFDHFPVTVVMAGVAFPLNVKVDNSIPPGDHFVDRVLSVYGLDYDVRILGPAVTNATQLVLANSDISFQTINQDWKSFGTEIHSLLIQNPAVLDAQIQIHQVMVDAPILPPEQAKIAANMAAEQSNLRLLKMVAEREEQEIKNNRVKYEAEMEKDRRLKNAEREMVRLDNELIRQTEREMKDMILEADRKNITMWANFEREMNVIYSERFGGTDKYLEYMKTVSQYPQLRYLGSPSVAVVRSEDE
jgi:hypothetical protein